MNSVIRAGLRSWAQDLNWKLNSTSERLLSEHVSFIQAQATQWLNVSLADHDAPKAKLESYQMVRKSLSSALSAMDRGLGVVMRLWERVFPSAARAELSAMVSRVEQACSSLESSESKLWFEPSRLRRKISATPLGKYFGMEKWDEGRDSYKQLKRERKKLQAFQREFGKHLDRGELWNLDRLIAGITLSEDVAKKQWLLEHCDNDSLQAERKLDYQYALAQALRDTEGQIALPHTSGALSIHQIDSERLLESDAAIVEALSQAPRENIQVSDWVEAALSPELTTLYRAYRGEDVDLRFIKAQASDEVGQLEQLDQMISEAQVRLNDTQQRASLDYVHSHYEELLASWQEVGQALKEEVGASAADTHWLKVSAMWSQSEKIRELGFKLSRAEDELTAFESAAKSPHWYVFEQVQILNELRGHLDQLQAARNPLAERSRRSLGLAKVAAHLA